jgi:hypothetical protein
MNGLKKLFSPSTLAATVASGMLLFSAVNALADCQGMYSVSAAPHSQNPGGCCYEPGLGLYWCCYTGSTCSGHPYFNGTWLGNCCP